MVRVKTGCSSGSFAQTRTKVPLSDFHVHFDCAGSHKLRFSFFFSGWVISSRILAGPAPEMEMKAAAEEGGQKPNSTKTIHSA